MLRLFEEKILFHECRKRRLNARRATESMSGANIGRQQLAAALEDDGAQDRALRQGQSLPHCFEHRVLLREQARERGMKMLEAHLPAACGPHVVPGFVSEALDVVWEVACEVDDRSTEARLGSNPAAYEAPLDEVGEHGWRNLLEAYHRSRFVERAARADHFFHQTRFRAREDITDVPLLLRGGAQRVLDIAAVEPVNGLKFVERDDDGAFPVGGQTPGKIEDFVGQAIHFSSRPNGGKADREVAIGLVPQLRPAYW